LTEQCGLHLKKFAQPLVRWCDQATTFLALCNAWKYVYHYKFR